MAAWLSASSAVGQDIAAGDDPASTTATAQALVCTAGASPGFISLAGGGSRPAVATAPEDDIAPAGDGDGQPPAAPASHAATSSGFVSLASGGAVVASNCSMAGAPEATAELVTDAAAVEAAVAAPAEPEVPPAVEVAVAARAPVAAPPSPPRAAKPRRPAKPPAAALKVWWPPAESGKLNLRFAGEAAFGQAIALLFDSPAPDAGTLAQHVRVKDKAGQTVEPKWQVVKSNPQMVALKVDPGLYTVRVEDGLTSSNGLRFDRTAEGKLFVR